jgi:hypothetical protein
VGNASEVVLLNEEREAVVIPLPVSMHTGQIIMLTKMLTASDLRFYGFEEGGPVERWHSGRLVRLKRQKVVTASEGGVSSLPRFCHQFAFAKVFGLIAAIRQNQLALLYLCPLTKGLLRVRRVG